MPFDEGAQVLGPSATRHLVSACVLHVLYRYSCFVCLFVICTQTCVNQMVVNVSEFVAFLKTGQITVSSALVVDELWLVGEDSKSCFVYGRAVDENVLELVTSKQHRQELISFWELFV